VPEAVIGHALRVQLAVAVALLVGAAPAAASYVQVEGDTLKIDGLQGEKNFVSVTPLFSGGTWYAWIVSDFGGAHTGPSTGPGCQPYTNPFWSHSAVCAEGYQYAVGYIDVSLGANNDSFDLSGPDPWLRRLVVHGGLGRDDLAGSPDTDWLQNRDHLFGGKGSDELFAKGGNDVLAGGRGHDELEAGPGKDRLRARDGTRDKEISCGRGRDRLKRDGKDPHGTRCP
jgi:Ca2+-binding RTX toxin-like protein